MVASLSTRSTALPCALAVLALAAALLARPSAASERIAGVDAAAVSLAVNARAEALVAYRTSRGDVRRVLVWGAINARAPDAVAPQVRFRYDYSGGWRKHRRAAWRTFRDACRPYDGPPLVYLVLACRTPDGSYWALQRWQRLQPMRGLPPFRPEHAAHELHLSHWSGALPVLEVSPNWTYGGRFQGLFGRLLYSRAAVHGFPASARRSGRYGRYFYIDTYNSAYGGGWKRDTAVAAHVGNGGFCYSFVPQQLPRDYPWKGVRGPGDGERHRVTVMGPGVTPIVQWEGEGLGRYDPARDERYNALFDRLLAGDRVCRDER